MIKRTFVLNLGDKFMIWLSRVVLVIFLVLSLSACGGGSGSGGNDGTGTSGSSSSSSGGSSSSSSSSSSSGGTADTSPPTASIDFPHMDGLKSNPGSVTVRGKAADDFGVKSVWVSGVEATSVNGFQSWIAEVSLESGSDNELVVRVEDVNGNITERAATRAVSVFPHYRESVCGQIAYDPIDGRVFNSATIDGYYSGVIATNVQNGSRSYFSRYQEYDNRYRQFAFSRSSGQLYALTGDGDVLEVSLGPAPDNMVSWDGSNDVEISDSDAWITLDNSTGALFIYAAPYKAVYSVDLTTGARNLVSGNGMGTGPDFSYRVAIAAANGRLFAYDSANYRLVEIDKNTGDRRLVSSGETDGEYLSYADGLVVDENAEKAYLSFDWDEITEVDLVSGEKRLVSGSGRQDSLESNLMVDFYGMALDSERGQLYLSCASHQLIAIDIENGKRARITPPERGSGPANDSPASIRFDKVHNRLLYINGLAVSYMPEIMAVDPVSGDRHIITSDLKGEGSTDSYFRDLAVSGRDGKIYASDNSYWTAAIVEVDPETGNRKFISGNGAGLGPVFSGPLGIELDDEAAVLYVVDGSGALFAVDLQTGNRSLASQPGAKGEGPEWGEPSSVALHPNHSIAYVTDVEQSRIYRVDLRSGDREIFSSDSDSIGGGPPIVMPWQIRLDPVRNKLVVKDYHGHGGMVFVDLETGDRERQLPSGSHGNGDVAVDPDTGLYYLSQWPGSIVVYDSGTAQGLVLSQ
ncbi:PQQ-binding-like beta-propeller repeat protein [Microbulbifer harenosus]|nr:PQQ-binding-like beta-propeller repeat protein [Microbulbifer harenosus]